MFDEYRNGIGRGMSIERRKIIRMRRAHLYLTTTNSELTVSQPLHHSNWNAYERS
ncbi:hypothetical protein DACRYDRAFT_21709 [Dacryopinax primogenitus]|uniref:Uncharacterized protein n=1 Tax=Dacryopinax primogenitus (strain DJM 731) TaxID=1858805 RepID=M5G9Z4_DACPD|nr:uncharacterized protein DACRYDRAFT_21709 [Dacryopinax primogenitus]EJU02712.1 hypothetical protein DACRYDRAFT_21709 [Dacryopinax primogenitus]